jgi:hypothetical protein
MIVNKTSSQHLLISQGLLGLLELVSLRQIISDLSDRVRIE